MKLLKEHTKDYITLQKVYTGTFKKKKNHLRSSISFQLDLSKIFLKQKHIVAVSFSLIQSIREHYNQNRPSKPIDQKHLHPNEVDEGAQKDLT